MKRLIALLLVIGSIGIARGQEEQPASPEPSTQPAAQPDRPVFEANWDSLNSRQTPAWFEDAKFGIFIHWGVYSVPAYCHTSTYAEWYQWWVKTNAHDGMERRFHEAQYGKDFLYCDFAPMFKAELWDPDQWAGVFKRSGARYVVLVSKHHDGFALWPTELGCQNRGYAWNSMQTGPKRDLCGELTEAVRKQGLKMGFYYSLMEWENPLFDSDPAGYVERQMFPQIKDLVERYQPAIIWPDGEWEHPDTFWRSPEILAWLYNNVPNPDEFLVNDRWGAGLRGHSGDYYTTEYGNVPWAAEGASSPRPFEECRGTGHSFAYNRLEDYDLYQSRTGLVRMLIDLVSNGGNLLLNIGPTADGRIPVIQQDRLIAIGDWLAVNGESIYGTRRGLFKNLPWGRSTTKGNTVYLHVFDWPADNTLEVPGLTTEVEKAYLLHDPNRTPLKLSGNGTGELVIDLLGYHPFEHASVIALECKSAPQVTNCILPAADGTVTLPAARAELKGKTIKLEEKADGVANVGYWLDPADTVEFTFRIEKEASYDVRVEFSCETPAAGSKMDFLFGDRSLPMTVSGTGDWATFETVSLGRLDLPAGEHVLVVKPVEVPNKFIMNLRKVVLVKEE